MFRISHVLPLIVVALLASSAAYGQNPPTSGTPPLGSFGSDSFDTINLANLNVHFTIPIFSRPGRGVSFNYNLQYDSSVWYPVGSSGNQTWTPVQNWGLLAQTAVATGYLSMSTNGTYNCYTYISLNKRWVLTGGTTTWWWNYYVDNWGVQHPLNTSSTANWGSCNGVSYPPSQDANATATDGSGYNLSTHGFASPSVANTSAWITTREGTVTYPPWNTNGGSATFTDRNGNQISVSTSGAFTDTLGTQALAVSGSGTSTSPLVFTYSAPGANGTGVNATATVNYTNFTVATNFGISGIHEYGAHSIALPTSIVLADGSQYSLTYEATPSTPSAGACTPLSGTYQTNCVTARIASITIPTGGTISYTYYNKGGNFPTCTTGNNGVFSDGSTSCLQITTPDTTSGTKWLYTRALGTGAASTTTVVDPQGNNTVAQFQGIYETQRQTYQLISGTQALLQTINTCYNGAASPCTGTAITLPISRRTQLVAYPDNTGSVCKHDQFFDSYGLQTELDDYDYGSGAPSSSPTRRQITVYNRSLTNGIVSMPSSTTICNGSGTSTACTGPSGSPTGTVVAQTIFCYDEATPSGSTTCGAAGSPTATSSTPQHVSITGSRGNVTTVNKLVSGSAFLATKATYFDTGNVQTATDANGAQMAYTYGACGNSFPTGISEPYSMSRSMTWNCVGGVPISVTDENNQTTTTTYSDAYFWRPAGKSFPDGGQTSWAYNSQTSTTTTTKMNSSQNIISTLLLDGLGRTKQAQLVSDSQGVDYQDTAYDSLGRVASVSNPYRTTGDPTYGVVSYTYDSLRRVTKATLQDGSIASASYSNNTFTVIDPAGKKRQSTLDSLGRLVQVTEDPGGLGYVTTYGYDALGNLTNVTQNGGRQRVFVYDAMSRLTSEINPESGTTSYKYDSDSNCTSPNSFVGDLVSSTDARNIRTCLQYDALHRLTQKNYSDGTPTAFFSWDGTGRWGITQTNTNGRLGEEWTGTSCCATGGAAIFGYDPLGRIVMNEQYTPTMSYRSMSYAYDLAGNMVTFTDGVGETYTQTFDGAGRPTQLNSSWVDSQHPATLVTVDSSVGYYPFGGLRKMSLGNNLTQTFAFNKNLQPCRINTNSSATTLGTCADALPSGNVQDFSYGFNFGSSDNGNIINWAGTGQQSFNRSYGYDSLNRVSSLSSPSDPHGCTGLSWGYDAWGNRTDQTVTGGSCLTFHQTANTLNRLGSPYQYDSAGNMTYDGNHTYFYDAENRLAQVDGTLGTCSTAAACYAYDAFGRRVHKTAGSAQTDYIFDLNGQVVSESNPSNWLNAYVRMHGALVTQYTIGSPRTAFVVSDHLSSTRLLTDMNQSIVQSLDYLPFGELNSSDSGITSHKFTSDERDSETGLDHTWFRQYSSQLGRWMTPDPAGLTAVDTSNPQSWNRYSYVLNNPLVFTDPMGLDTCYWDYVSNELICIPTVVDSVTVNGVAELLSGGGGGMGPMWPCAGFVSRQCGPIPPSPSGFTLGVRQKSQTWKQCMEANKNTYSLGGAVELTVNAATGTNSNISESTSVITGNGITDTLFGDPTDIAKTAGLATAEAGAGTTLTWGRRTSDLVSMNLAGKGGLPKALGSSGANGLLKSLGKALNAGLDEAEKLAVDLGLAGAEAIGCSIPAGNVLP